MSEIQAYSNGYPSDRKTFSADYVFQTDAVS